MNRSARRRVYSARRAAAFIRLMPAHHVVEQFADFMAMFFEKADLEKTAGAGKGKLELGPCDRARS
jgi:hypothetical protein